MKKSKKAGKPASSNPSPETSKTFWRIKLTERLLREIAKLPPEDRVEVNRALISALPAWGSPHTHQGAGIRKLGTDLFECRAGLRWRLLFKAAKPERELVFFEVGDHDQIRKILKGR